MKKIKQKSTKKIMVLVVAYAAFIFFPADTFANNDQAKVDRKPDKIEHCAPKPEKKPHCPPKPPRKKVRNHGGNTVGAPLDGGLSAILLGAAGTAFVVRQRKKKMLTK